MILNQFKSLFREAEPITREFIGLMEASFRPYAEMRGTFQQQLPSHLHDSALVSLLTGEIKSRLFAPALCESIPDALKALRRSIIRLEDLRQAHPTLPPAVNDLESLARLAERVEALYQRHWELFRYQSHLDEQALLGLLLEVDGVWTDWQAYLLAFHSTRQVQEALSGQPLPANSVLLRITYTQAPPLHFSVRTLTALAYVLDAAYRFVAAVRQVDATALPLAMQHVEVA
ncbi:MAG TPA: hypothetical protein VL359_18195, partial [bacterium]|nr:hypothetical protein [bacterium]